MPMTRTSTLLEAECQIVESIEARCEAARTPNGQPELLGSNVVELTCRYPWWGVERALVNKAGLMSRSSEDAVLQKPRRTNDANS